jgi:hypothetical protein
MKEAGVVIDHDGHALHWHAPQGRTVASIPDSRPLWEVLWENREHVFGFAHTHPCNGIPGPSGTDLSTFKAVEAGLGRRLMWFILSEDHASVTFWFGPDDHYETLTMTNEPECFNELRYISYGKEG